MEEQSNTKEKKDKLRRNLIFAAPVFTYILGNIVGGLLFGPFATYMETRENYTAPKNKHTMVYDVNKDGLTDVVSKDGSVEIRQEDGTYLSLQTVMENHTKRVIESYQLKKGEDGRYYTKGDLESQE